MLRGDMRIALSMMLIASSLSACHHGDARFDSDFDRPFDVGGTVFSYLDETRADLSTEADPRVVVAMTWVVFNPAGDLNDRPGDELDAIRHELGLRDAMSLVFANQGEVDAGESFEVIIEGDQQMSIRGLQAFLHLSPERLNADSTYDGLLPFASKRTVTVDIEQATFVDSAASVNGDITIKFEAVEGRDPGSAREGLLTGTFAAPLVTERTAEQNLAVLRVEEELGLPLSDRAVVP
jgi:hypothetical protein